MPEISSPATPRNVLVVSLGRYQLEFLSNAQLEAAMAFFRATSGATRMQAIGGDHWEFQPWQSRLPAGMKRSHNRRRLLAALETSTALAREQLP